MFRFESGQIKSKFKGKYVQLSNDWYLRPYLGDVLTGCNSSIPQRILSTRVQRVKGYSIVDYG